MESYNNAVKIIVSLIKIAQKYALSLGIFNYTRRISTIRNMQEARINANNYAEEGGKYELFLTCL